MSTQTQPWTARVFSEGRYYTVNVTPAVLHVLQCCVKWDGAYLVARRSERETVLRERAKEAA